MNGQVSFVAQAGVYGIIIKRNDYTKCHELNSGRDVHSLRPSRGIRRAAPVRPGHPLHHRLREAFARKHFVKQAAVEERLLGGWRVVGETLRGSHELLIGNMGGSVLLNLVDPLVTDSIRKLFLLAP